MLKLLKFIVIFFIFFVVIVKISNLFDKSDYFYDCNLKLTTNKESYKIGEKIHLTIEINPKNDRKKIRMYKNLKNIILYPTFHRIYDAAKPELGLCSYPSLIKNIRKEKKEDDIVTYLLTPSESFKHTFNGFIEYDKSNDLITINFRDFGYKCQFLGKDYDNSINFGFSGQCYPINPSPVDSFEDYFNFKQIKIIR